MKKLQKVALAAAIFATIGTAQVKADGLQDQLKDIFGNTNLVQPEKVDEWVEKGKEKYPELKEKTLEKFNQAKDYTVENWPTWKEKASDTFEASKDWLQSYSDTQGRAAVPADGYYFFHAGTNKVIAEAVYIVVDNTTVKKPQVFFATQDGQELSSFEFTDTRSSTYDKFRFIKIASPRKVRSNYVGDRNPLPDNQYYVWAEVGEGDNRVVRAVPVSKETFKTLKKSSAGTEFVPLHNE